jgi:hypothetical protein
VPLSAALPSGNELVLEKHRSAPFTCLCRHRPLQFVALKSLQLPRAMEPLLGERKERLCTRRPSNVHILTHLLVRAIVELITLPVNVHVHHHVGTDTRRHRQRHH